MKDFFTYQKIKFILTAFALIPLGLIANENNELSKYQNHSSIYFAQSKGKYQKGRKGKFKKKRKKTTPELRYTEPSIWGPQLISINQIQAKKSPFFQFNVGVGFLYFSDISCNLGGAPSRSFIAPPAPLPDFSSVPFKGKLNYNRTPLYEAILGYRIWPWFKMALSYQHQGNVVVNTEPLLPSNNTLGMAQFFSQLEINTIMAKFYFELPYPVIVKNVASSPYIAGGVGPSWQSWTQNQVNYYNNNPVVLANPFRNRFNNLNDKISANVAWMVDIGIRFQDAVRHQLFSISMGCKYNQYGQARNIGALQDQAQLGVGLEHSIRIKTVYSFAPYVGAQWNFPSNYSAHTPVMVNGRDANSWIPFWINAKYFEETGLWTQFNVGPGFLYFNGAKGVVVPDGITTNTIAGPTSPTAAGFSSWSKLRGGVKYNRTPLVEFMIGYNIIPWFRAAFSLQNQSNVSFQTNWQQFTTPTARNFSPHMSMLSANLNFNSAMLRLFFDSPWSMVFKSVNFRPFVGAGLGGGWQSWTNLTAQDVIVNPGSNRNRNPRFLRQKICANFSWLVDVGFKLKSVLKDRNFSALAGFKFNYWGQARNLGKLSQQGGNKQFLVRPLSYKYVYSVIPYLGVQWNFPVIYNYKKAYSIDGKSIHNWAPFFTCNRNFQDKNSLWTQFNVGPGFLYFDNFKGDLTINPGIRFGYDAALKPQLQGKLTYNKTPLYEFMIGYRFNQWVKAAVSYLHQGNIYVQTEPQISFIAFPNSNPLVKATFRSSLQLDAILAKGIVELPYSMIFKSIAISPYLGTGVGVSWQTWQAVVQHISFDNGLINLSTQQPINRKICPNAFWMADFGLRSRSAYPNSPFSVLLGCKFNIWGQAKNIGKLSQQGALNVGITRAFKIRTIYQFAPYIGGQWNF